MKVLIVEDHPDMRDLLGRIVERMGYVPALASKGEEGVEKAIAEKPNLILLDMMMPKMDGREVARRLRANPDTKEIPILAITALHRSHDLNGLFVGGLQRLHRQAIWRWGSSGKDSRTVSGHRTTAIA
jgi:two-component system, cell cycle response regulator DivK